MNNCNKLAQAASNRMSRINCLVSKMLSNPSDRSESTSSTENKAASRTSSVDRQAQGPVASNPNIKRNLFGIRLNHDQLKTDLNTMWKEQVEVQKVKWNFDFETLKPVKQQDENANRFKWTKVNFNTAAQTPIKSDFCLAAVTKEELELKMNYFEEQQENCEEEDEALAIPQFYKFQRRLKLSEDKNRINQLNNQLTSTPVKDSKDKTRQQEPVEIKTGPVEDKLQKPKPVKKTSKLLGLKQEVHQIITFSENRKDTLRSASSSNSKASKVVKSDSSAFKSKEASSNGDNMKQQSLLDMFKQRKRRINANAMNKESKSTKVETNENLHYLRSQANSNQIGSK